MPCPPGCLPAAPWISPTWHSEATAAAAKMVATIQPLRALRPSRQPAVKMMASTAGLMPAMIGSICGCCPCSTYSQASAVVISTAGRMNATPATASPAQPPRTKPMWIAISVEFGPGIKFVAPDEVQEVLPRQPAAALDHLILHEGQMRRRTAEADAAQLQKQAGNFKQATGHPWSAAYPLSFRFRLFYRFSSFSRLAKTRPPQQGGEDYPLGQRNL